MSEYKEWIAGIILLGIIIFVSEIWMSQSVKEQQVEKALEEYYYQFCSENDCQGMTKNDFMDYVRQTHPLV